MPDLILGPILRYAGESDATVWVETDAAREVEVRADGFAQRSRTFEIGGHHYALVRLSGLQPGQSYEYEVALDGEKVWPVPDDPFPAPVIRTADPDGEFRLAYGSCRVSAPHEPPYTLSRSASWRIGVSGGRFEQDALYALAVRMRDEPNERWPHALFLLGDQIYADEVSPGTQEFIRSRRGGEQADGGPPPDQVADFEEYTHLYRDAWQDPATRWLLSTVPSVMIFDDHDVHDDWNISEAWVEEMHRKPWWAERIIGAFMSYWVYQHLGNLSPAELEEDEMFQRVRGSGEPTQHLREFAREADREVGRSRWSFHRDFGNVRLIVADSRAGRVVSGGRRSMLDDEEWAWVEEQTTGDFDHVLIGTSVPFLLAPGIHHLEAASEAVCAGVWGGGAARLGEKLRQAVDLEHWSAFQDSFVRLTDLLKSVGRGERTTGEPPSSVLVLSGDVHHGYLARANLGGGVRSAVYQSVGSPVRNPLGVPERLVFRLSWSRVGKVVGKALSRLAGVKEQSISWRLEHERPWFDNHISTLEIKDRKAKLRVEKTTPEDPGEPRLYTLLERDLT